MARRNVITAKTPQAKIQWIVERDLCTLTGPEILAKYGKPGSPQAGALFDVTGKPPGEFYDHNPFWYYLLQVWFDDDLGRGLLYEPRHKAELADTILKFVLGEFDGRDGVHFEYPRRGLKSTLMTAAADWTPKRHKLVDGIDITQFYVHNNLDQAKERLGLIKDKNRYHAYIAKYFPEFHTDPEVEWDTQDAFDWPCKKKGGTASGPSIKALSLVGKKAGKGANYRWLDDCEDEDSRESEVIRKKANQNYEQLRQLKAPPFAREFYCNTPYHLHGLTLTKRGMKDLKGNPRYHVVVVPALDDDGKPLFPTIPALTVEGLARERANEVSRTGNDFFWTLQYLLDARMTGIQAFEWEWFQPLSVADFRAKFANRSHFGVILADTAWKGDENQGSGDDTAIGVVKIYRNGEFFDYILCDLVVSNEMVSDEGADTICRLAKKWGIAHTAPEMSGEKTFVGTLKQAYRKNGVWLTVIDLKGWSKKAKESRIGALAGAARTGHVFYMENLPHLEQFRRQIEDHPQNLHEDIIDMWANAFATEIEENWMPFDMYDDLRESAREASYAPPLPVLRHAGVH